MPRPANRFLFIPAFLCFFNALMIYPALALTPEQVAVIANSKASNSLELAKFYMEKRSIPAENLITIRTTWKESCERETYNKEIAAPVQASLKRLLKKKRIRALVTVYGLPLKIKPPAPDFDDQEEIRQLELQVKTFKEKNTGEVEKSSPKKTLDALNKKIRFLKQTDTRAAVDSELALVLSEPYPLDGWLPNPYFLGLQGISSFLSRDKVLMVARLDGPDPSTVRRIITDTLETEKNGLSGIAYIDARWKKPAEGKTLSGYALYDGSLHAAAERLKEKKGLPVVVNQENKLFQPGECPEAALYCGWYSLGKYIDAFTWKQGAIGYHIASAECSTLKNKKSRVWCKRMLEMGVAATVGPVYEPYVQGFPLPEIFFAKLIEGYLTLGEVYLISLPFLSWQVILVGDPLYSPFPPAD